MRLGMVFGLVVGLVMAGLPSPTHAPAAASPGGQSQRPNLLSIARGLQTDMSYAQMVDMLRAHHLALEMEADLPPDGLIRLLLAVPADDDCLPRGEPLTCPNLRVHFLNDAARGPRAVRVEAFEPLRADATVAAILHELAHPMGPPAQRVAYQAQVRGGSVHVWRQRWQEGDDAAPQVEILVTWEGSHLTPSADEPPREIATGKGFVRIDGGLARRLELLQQRMPDGR